MEAGDARSLVEQLLRFDDYNFNSFLSEYDNVAIDDNNPVVTRLMLTSSRKYKSFRAKNASTIEEAFFYANIMYPIFLWVAEISSHNEYEKKKVFGEIVLDATAAVTGATNNYENSVILLRYFDHIGYSDDDSMIELVDEDGNKSLVYSTRFGNMLDTLEETAEGFSTSFAMYENNLRGI